MSKGLDLLITSKKEDVAGKSTKSSSITSKKEGSSLFDSLLSSAKKDLKATTESQVSIKSEEIKKRETLLTKTLPLEQSLKNISTKLGINEDIKTLDKGENKELKNNSIHTPKDTPLQQEVKVPLNKEENISSKATKNSNSLMDRLFQNTKQTVDEQKVMLNEEKAEVKKDKFTEKIIIADKLKTIDINNSEKNSEKKDVITTIDKKTVLTESLVKESESKNVKTEILSDKNSKKIVSDKEVENTQIEEKKETIKDDISKTNRVNTQTTTILKENTSKIGDNNLEKEIDSKIKKVEETLENIQTIKVDPKIKEDKERVLENKTEETDKKTLNKSEDKTSLIDKILAKNKEPILDEKLSFEKTSIKDADIELVPTSSKNINNEKIDLNKNEKNLSKESSQTLSLKSDESRIDKNILKQKETTLDSNDLNNSKINLSNSNNKEVDNSSLNIDKNLFTHNNKENQSSERNPVELSKLSNSKDETLDTNLAKESLKTSNKVDTKSELFNQKVVSNETSNNKQVFTKTEEPIHLSKKISLEEMMKGSINSDESLKQSKNEMVTNIYLSSQKKSLADNSLEIKSEVINNIKNAKSTKDVEKGAKALNLGLEKQEVTIEKSIEEPKVQKLVSSSTFDKLSLFRNNVKDSLENKTVLKGSLDILSQNILKSENLEEKVVELSVNLASTPTLQNRIVAARQQMATMMSDLARTMYENYKPPVTAFRINLNPSSLGSIAIVLRNDQKNSLSINMNISNHSTKEIMIENQVSLRDSLSKTFEGASNFNLNFDASEETYNSANQENNSNKNFEDEFVDSSTVVSNNQNESSEEVEKNLNYM